jgi:hypothetical protein
MWRSMQETYKLLDVIEHPHSDRAPSHKAAAIIDWKW